MGREPRRLCRQHSTFDASGPDQAVRFGCRCIDRCHPRGQLHSRLDRRRSTADNTFNATQRLRLRLSLSGAGCGCICSRQSSASWCCECRRSGAPSRTFCAGALAHRQRRELSASSNLFFILLGGESPVQSRTTCRSTLRRGVAVPNFQEFFMNTIRTLAVLSVVARLCKSRRHPCRLAVPRHDAHEDGHGDGRGRLRGSHGSPHEIDA